MNESLEKTKRTIQQNKAFHKYFTMLGDSLNDAGLDMKKVLKPGVEIPWTPEMVKKHLWNPIQYVMLDKDSTTKLNTDEVDKVYKVLSRHISDKFGVNVEFPDRFGQ
jgi:hypothetical protein